MQIKFIVATEFTGNKKPKGTIIVGEEYNGYVGEYVIHEISAYEGNEAINALIAENKDLQENPDSIKPIQLRKKQIEKATTLNGKPLVIADLSKFPNKIWQVLVAANEQLNTISLEEARFLLSPYGDNKQPSIQQ